MNKSLALVGVAGLVLGALVGYFLFSGSNAGKLSGVSINADSALSQARLQSELSLIATPLTGFLQATSSMGNVTVGSTTVQSSTITLTGAVVGDYLVFGESTSTGNVNLNCEVSAANTVLCTKTSAVPGSAGIAAVTSTVYVNDLPKSTFVSPTGL